MKLLNKQEFIQHSKWANVKQGTNRVLEFPFRIEIKGVLNNVFTDVMVIIDRDDKVVAIEFDIVEGFYTQDQKNDIENLLKRELC